MIQLTEKELFELMTNLYNRKDNFNTLADAHEYINNEISKVKNLDLATVVNPLKDEKAFTFEDWLYKNQIKKIDRLYFAKDGTEQEFNSLHRRYVQTLQSL